MAFVSLLLFSVMVPNTAYPQSPPPTDPYVYVLVGGTLYASLSSALSTYRQDLENDGFSVEIIYRPYLPNTAEGIRELLQNEAETHEIAGALLVGDVPYAMYVTKIGEYNYTYPWDLYYMDLDGNWTDSNGDGVYDKHLSGDGDLGPEIWVGRLWASTMTGNEEELLINYFDKDHRFRTGELALPRRALAYVDDGFVYGIDDANSSLRMIYGNETTLIIDPETTSAKHYKNTLNDTLGYEWLHLEAHGNFMAHCFNTSKGWTDIYSSEVRSVDPHAFFYNLMACRTTDYSRQDYIGGSYIFADTYGLLAVGCTKPGKMFNYMDFYGPISEGKCIGQAFKEWFEKNGELDRIFYYGLTILGDPTLRTPRIYNETRDVVVTRVTAGDSCYNATEVHSGWGITIYVTLKNKGIFIETVNVTVYYDGNIIEKQTVNVFPGADRILTLIWNTTGVPPCRNYTISAYAHPVPNETFTLDNMLVDGRIHVRILGDVDGDHDVDGGDMRKIQLDMWEPVETRLNHPYSDLDGDGDVDGGDMRKCQLHMWEAC